LSAELTEAFDAVVHLERGHSGIYDVLLDGKLVYSKDELGRFPEEGEIAEIIEEQPGR
jgi:predicted Rdx family selenoprotein